MKRESEAGLLWLLDVPGAALFAWGVADGVAVYAGGGGIPVLACLEIVAGGVIRAGSVRLAHGKAIANAQAAVVPMRARLLQGLLGPAPERRSIGETAALAIDHPITIEAYRARFLPVRFASAAAPLLVLGFVACASLVAAGILLATLLPFVLGLILGGSLARQASQRQLEALRTLSGLFVDRVRNLRVIRHFGAEERIARQVSSATQQVADRTLVVLRAAFLSSAVLEFFAALAVALVAVYCGFSLLGLLPFPNPEQLTLREAFFALAMAPEFYLPMRRLAAAYHEKQLGEAAELALAEVPAQAAAAAAPPSPFVGVRASGVELQRGERRIGPVSFEIGRTGLVAVTGPTGAGKSSLLAAIAGQIRPASGEIDQIDPGQIGWAAQHPLLLPGSLRDHIALARPAASDVEILEAAAAVGLDALIARRAEGLDLPLDHRGAGLSGGERRRLGLARALLSGRPLLLCDEPTADLDRASADAIVSRLTELSRSHAIIVATHDAALIAAADAEVRL